MEDSKLLLYIVLGAIYFISKFLKSNKRKAQDAEGLGEESISDNDAGPSFEELLQDMTGQKTLAEAQVVEVPKQEPIIRDAISSKQERLEIPEVLEKDIKNIKSIDRPESQLRNKPKYERADRYAIEEDEDNTVAADIMDLLSDTHGAKRVIVANEILQRKY